MEAEDGSTFMGKAIVTSWSGDWNQKKRGFKAAACLNGLAEAMEVAELVDNGATEWPEVAPIPLLTVTPPVTSIQDAYAT